MKNPHSIKEKKRLTEPLLRTDWWGEWPAHRATPGALHQDKVEEGGCQLERHWSHPIVHSISLLHHHPPFLLLSLAFLVFSLLLYPTLLYFGLCYLVFLSVNVLHPAILVFFSFFIVFHCVTLVFSVLYFDVLVFHSVFCCPSFLYCSVSCHSCFWSLLSAVLIFQCSPSCYPCFSLYFLLFWIFYCSSSWYPYFSFSSLLSVFLYFPFCCLWFPLFSFSIAHCSPSIHCTILVSYAKNLFTNVKAERIKCLLFYVTNSMCFGIRTIILNLPYSSVCLHSVMLHRNI